jgi:hypothetical protein
MKENENISRQGSISSVIEDIVSDPSKNNVETYANGVVLTYLDTLLSGTDD